MRRILSFLTLLVLFTGCSQHRDASNSVTIYVSEDQVFSEPILKAFEKETGIKVDARYDTEESKGTGVMNRLIAEKSHPQADLYWANEPIRAEVLKSKGVLSPYHSPQAKEIPDTFKDAEGYWTGFSARARLFVVHNTSSQDPQSIMDYIAPVFRGKGVIANPLFGTTAIQIAALFTKLGENNAKAFMQKLKENHVAIATSNGESADLVAKGEYLFSLVDSDDAISRLRAGAPIHFIYPDQGEHAPGTLILPNAVMMIKGAPHPQNAKKLIDYLLSKKTEMALAAADCAQIPLRPDLPAPKELKPLSQIKTMSVDYADVARKMITLQPFLKQWSSR